MREGSSSSSTGIQDTSSLSSPNFPAPLIRDHERLGGVSSFRPTLHAGAFSTDLSIELIARTASRTRLTPLCLAPGSRNPFDARPKPAGSTAVEATVLPVGIGDSFAGRVVPDTVDARVSLLSRLSSTSLDQSG